MSYSLDIRGVGTLMLHSKGALSAVTRRGELEVVVNYVIRLRKRWCILSHVVLVLGDARCYLNMCVWILARFAVS